MKNLFNTLFLLICLLPIGNAQITLTSANAPTARTAHKMRYTDTTAAKQLNVGTAGTGKTWNFSTVALDPNEPVELKTFAATTGAPQANQFPTATLISRYGLTNNQGVDYHRINATEWVLLGSVDSAGEVSVSPDPEVYFKYPFTYNTNFKDTTTVEDPDLGTLVTIKTSVTGDASGTIQTQLGTFNTLRVKRDYNGSFSFFGFPIDFKFTYYEWWTSQHSAPVFTHNQEIISSADLGIADTSYYATVLTAQTVANQEVAETNYIAKVYPTPATNTVTLDLDLPISAQISALILSTNGQGMKTHQLGSLPAGKQTTNLDVSQLTSGVYQVVLMSEKGKIGTQKITVSH
ncbi:MAG: T9SS type A sorting domain-containing protein [Saprospiraceae bacterium]|nr:T9SS type A sorting domain-containing protein [Saprospiraceae bacterium]